MGQTGPFPLGDLNFFFFLTSYGKCENHHRVPYQVVAPCSPDSVPEQSWLSPGCRSCCSPGGQSWSPWPREGRAGLDNKPRLSLCPALFRSAILRLCPVLDWPKEGHGSSYPGSMKPLFPLFWDREYQWCRAGGSSCPEVQAFQRSQGEFVSEKKKLSVGRGSWASTLEFPHLLP